MRTQILIFFISLLALSCEQSQDSANPPHFPKEARAVFEPISDEDIVIPYPETMCVDSSYIYVLSLMDQQWIHIYDRHKGTYIKSCIAHGRGPNEIIQGANLQIDEKNGTLSVYDHGKMACLTFKIEIRDGIPYLYLHNDESLMMDGQIIRNVWRLATNEFLVDGQLGASESPQRFQKLCQGKLISEYNIFPTTDEANFLVYLKNHISISPDSKKMAVGTVYGGGLEIFDMQGDIKNTCIRRFYPPQYPSQENVKNGEFGTPFCFTNITSTDKYIYGIWNGTFDPNSNNNLVLFDWNGNEIIKYITDTLLIKASIYGNKIYAIAFSEERDFHIVTFDISQWER